MAKDLVYGVEIDTSEARRALTGLKSTIGGVGAALAAAFTITELTQVAARFEDLRTTLGTVFKDIEAGSAAFEQIKAFATTSVLSVEDLTQTVIKLKAAGLDPTTKQLQLFADIASVTTDKVGALQAITDLYARTTAGGLGLEDLNRLQDRGIPVFTLLADEAGLARDEISKVGQSAEGAQAILAVLQAALEKQFTGASADKANTLSQAISNLGDALDNMFDTIGQSGFNEALTTVINNMSAFITKNQQLIVAIGQALGKAIEFAAANLKYLGALMSGVFAAAVAGRIIAIVGAVIQLAKGFRDAAIAGTILQGVTGVGLIKVTAGLAAAAAAVVTIEQLTGDASANIEDLQKDLANLKDGPILPDAPAPVNLENALNTINNIKAGGEQIAATTSKYFADYANGVEALKKNVQQQTELLKLTEDQAEVQRQLNSFESDYLRTVQPLQQKIIELKAKNTDASKAEAAEIEKQIGLITELYNNTTDGLKEALELQQQINRQVEREAELRDALKERVFGQIDFIRELNGVEDEFSNKLEDLNLNPLQQQLKDAERMIGSRLVNATRFLADQLHEGLITPQEYRDSFAAYEKHATEAYERVKVSIEQLNEKQRSFEYGWKKAFESYQDEATNAAKNAERVFSKATQGMEDAIVSFAKTGKFEFKSFVASILEDLLRAQIRQSIASIFSIPGSGGGTIGGGLGNVFGGFFANGGFLPSNKLGIVGERGPELISGPANVTPLNGLGGNVTYNINAVDALSFRQLVARDPGFIHAVAMKGGSAIPSGR